MDTSINPSIRAPLESQLRFSKVEVDFNQDRILGQGRFGTVYKAKCDQLQCAAKYLHCEGATEESIVKMEIQCQLLPMLRHPSIIQYLGTVRHADMNRPIILMELMEENLTDYLKRMTNGVPYYIKVNICHDVALALEYLHSNEIIHGSLSSNNVLISGESQAKVTDYWIRQLTPLPTKESDINVYMPPECLMSPPKCTKESDSFSFGVLAIQLDTQCYPQPKNGSNIEIDRRKIDIDRMEESSHFKPFALDCLNNDHQLRPKLAALCSRLALMKRASLYPSSIKESRDECSILKEEIQSCQGRLKNKNREIEEMRVVIQTMESKIQHMSRTNDDLVRKIEENEGIMKQLLIQKREFSFSPASTSTVQLDEPDFPVS